MGYWLQDWHYANNKEGAKAQLYYTTVRWL